MVKNFGPNAETWTVPNLIKRHSEYCPLIFTRCVQLVRNDLGVKIFSYIKAEHHYFYEVNKQDFLLKSNRKDIALHIMVVAAIKFI